MRTLTEQFEQRVAESGDATALRYHDGGAWAEVSFSEWHKRSTTMAAGLIDLGVGPGDRVAVISSTRMEWVLADMAVLFAGAVVVPMYETVRARQARLILDDAGASVVFVEGPVQLEKLARVADELPNLRAVIYFDELTQLPSIDEEGRTHLRLEDVDLSPLGDRVRSLVALRERGALALGGDNNLVNERRRDIHADALASIVYTAGTTGRPRGVALTHGAFATQVEANLLALPLGPSDEQVLFLPLAQMLARSIYLTMAMAGGVNAFSRGIAWLVRDLSAVQPTLFVGVPRIFERFYEDTVRRIVGKSDLRKRLVGLAENAARAKSEHREGLRPFGLPMRAQHAASDPLLYSPLRRVFGRQLRFAVSGGALMRPELARVFDGAGVKILEGYGLAEHCAAVAVNRFDDYRVGTVGRPLPGVEVRIAADGEILVRSSCVMRGYWNDPEGTATTLAGAWLHTGDVGEYDGNYLRVTDRKLDVIVTGDGRRVTPTPIEAALRSSPFIEHAVVHGDGRKFLSALITLSEPHARRWAADHGLGDLPLAELAQHAALYEEIEAAVERVNAELPPNEAVQRFAVLPGDFTAESGELTATWKTRRQFVSRKYHALLDGFYE